MAYRFLTAANRYLSAKTAAGANVAAITGYPYTVAGWFKVPDVTTNYVLFSIGDGANEQIVHVRAAGASGGDPLQLRRSAGGADVTVSTSTGFIANKWHHFFVAGASSTSGTVMLDGGGRGFTSSSSAPGTVDRTHIGATHGALLWTSGLLAEIACWNVALADAYAKSLYSGEPAEKVRPDNIVSHWTLKDGSLKDSGRNGYHLTVVNGALAATEMDPVVRMRPFRRTFLRASAAAATRSTRIVQGGPTNYGLAPGGLVA